MTFIWVSLVAIFVVVIAVTLLVGRRSTAFRDNEALRKATAEMERAERERDNG
jgi:type IV secretory pathway VirB3-like protein